MAYDKSGNIVWSYDQLHYSEYCRLAWSKEGDKLAVFRSDHVLIISRDGLLLSNISQVRGNSVEGIA